MNKQTIVVVGSLNLDLVSRVPRIPAPGETLIGLDFKTYCGGKGANQAVALARLGADTRMIGKLGSDGFARQLRQGLEDAGVDAELVESVPGPSGTALITNSEDGENSIVVIPGANRHLFPRDLDRHRVVLEQAAMIVAQLEVPPETTEHLGRIAQAAGVPLLLDPAPAFPLSRPMMESVTWLTPNETETRHLLGLELANGAALSAAECAGRLLANGARNVILKLGSKGVYMAGKDVDGVFVSSFPVHAVDTTGAGDAFNAAFAFALVCRHNPPQAAARFACAAAAVSVTRAGAQASMPTVTECEDFLDQVQSTGEGSQENTRPGVASA